MSNPSAGRELDCRIAQKVMGYTVFRCQGDVVDFYQKQRESEFAKNANWEDYVKLEWYLGPPYPTQVKGTTVDHGQVPYYSTSIADAWEVVEKMRESSMSLEMTTGIESGCTVKFREVDDTRHRATARTAPEAICLAALAALAEEGGQA